MTEIKGEVEPTVRGPDRVTLDLLDSTDAPVERSAVEQHFEVVHVFVFVASA